MFVRVSYFTTQRRKAPSFSYGEYVKKRTRKETFLIKGHILYQECENS
ncbi:hypothetical protein [Helicobacter pylori]